MTWPTNPTSIEDIPLNYRGIPTFIADDVEAVLCRIVTGHHATLERLTEGDEAKERELGSLLLSVAHRTAEQRLPIRHEEIAATS